MNEKLKRYIDLYVPITTCNFRCPYCYISHCGLFNAAVPEFKYSPQIVKKALSKERLGGTCLINICGGGETLIPEQITDYIRVLLENGHYISIVTNGSLTKRFEEIANLPPEYLTRIFFKFSYHYTELKRKKAMKQFFDNIRKMRDAGCSFVLELTPNDESIPFIDDIYQTAISELGAACHVTIARNDVAKDNNRPILTNLSEEEFYDTWGVFDSDMLTYKRTIFGKKRKEFCYAGDWAFVLDLGSGAMSQCYAFFKQTNIFEKPDEPIDFTPIGHHCPMPHCYNGHAWLTLGCIPEHECITYAQLRNRVCADGSEWLKPNVKEFFSCKLKDNNREYSWGEKAFHTIRYCETARKLKNIIRKLKK